MRRWNMAAVVFILALAAGIGGLLIVGGKPNRFVVRNASGLEIRDLRLVAGYRGKPESQFVRPVLALGESWTMRHSYMDSLVRLEFQLGGVPKSFDTQYIDLWRGEGWVLEVQPDGSVKQGYDYPGHALR